MKRLRIGILDFYNIQLSQRQSVVFNTKRNKAPKGFTLLSNAIRKMGHIPIVYHPEHCQLFFDNKKAMILYKGKEIKGCNVIIPRINVVSNIALELSFIKQFQLMGIPVVNGYLPISRAMNKLHTMQLLTRHKIPVPKTVVVRQIEYLDDAIKMVGGYPVIIKSPFGTHGNGVAIIESRRSLHSAMDILWKYGKSNILLIQEYVAEAFGCDYRAFVVGDKVVASMKRVAQNGDFRSNLFLGGNAFAVKLSPEAKSIAIRSTRALGLETCGVDLLRSEKGPVVMEINACAGIVGITKATGVDVSKKLVEYAVNLANSGRKIKIKK